MTIKFGSVCSGIESASIAWEPLGMQAEWFSEIEPFPAAVLKHHWPDVINLGDMTLIKDMVEMGIVDSPDVLVGGTPCQAFSVAGARKGLDDERGQLTIEYVRLLDVLDQQRRKSGRPETVCVWENVPGVLSSKDNAFGCFLGALAGEDCELQPAGKKWTNAGCVFGPKRTVAWRVLNSQYFGVAQRRRRVFVVSSARSGFDPRKVLFESEGYSNPPEGSLELCAATTITCGSAGNANSRGVVLFDGRNFRALTPEEEECRQGFPKGHTDIPMSNSDRHRYKAIGNSKAVPVVKWLGERLLHELQ